MIAGRLALGDAAVSLAVTASAHAQNSYSFSDTAKSPINYSIANAKPQMQCAGLRALSRTDPRPSSARS